MLFIVSTIVERLISITKVGRRERPEPVLIISETSIPRLLPREDMKNLTKAMKFVHQCEFEDGKYIWTLRAFIVRRLLGSIDKTEMDSLMAKGLRESIQLTNVLDRGVPPALHLDTIAERLLKRAEECEGETRAERPGLIEDMFS